MLGFRRFGPISSHPVFKLEYESDRKFIFSTPLASEMNTAMKETEYSDIMGSRMPDVDTSEPFSPTENIICNCKNSKCLKLYCHCFRAGKYCTHECLCVSCKNKEEYQSERTRAMETIKSRNPLAFKPRIDTVENVVGRSEPDWTGVGE